MNINTKPTTSTVTEDDYALISQNSAVRRASFAEIVEFMQDTIVVNESFTQAEINALW